MLDTLGNLIDWIGDYEKWMLDFIAVMMVLIGVYTVLDNQTPECPRYQQYRRGSTDRLISNRLAALLTYPNAFLIPSYCLYISKNATYINVVLVMFIITHYLQRTFIYGIFIKGNSKIPVRIWRLASTFCAVNGYMIGRYHSEYAVYNDHWLTDPRFIIGGSTFFIGMAINIHSDHILRNLRAPRETGYKIPRGGLFEYVSGANYFGEIVEWAGFSIACWTPHSVAFAFFTAGYVGLIKSFAHHKWYLEKFEDYPKDRKVIIPFLI